MLHHKRNRRPHHVMRCDIQGFDNGAKCWPWYPGSNPKGEWEHDGDGTMVKQTGKAMPVQFAEYVSKQIAAFIKKEEFTSSGQRVIPPNEYVDAAKKWYCQEVGYTKQKEACGECWLAKHCSIRVEKYGMPATRTVGQVATAPARSATEGVARTTKAIAKIHRADRDAESAKLSANTRPGKGRSNAQEEKTNGNKAPKLGRKSAPRFGGATNPQPLAAIKTTIEEF